VLAAVLFWTALPGWARLDACSAAVHRRALARALGALSQLLPCCGLCWRIAIASVSPLCLARDRFRERCLAFIVARAR